MKINFRKRIFLAIVLGAMLIQSCTMPHLVRPAAPKRAPGESWEREVVVSAPKSHLLGKEPVLFWVRTKRPEVLDIFVNRRWVHLWQWDEARGWLPQGWMRDDHRVLTVPTGISAFAVHGPDATVSFGLRPRRSPRIGRVFSHFKGRLLVPLEAPVSGATIRAFVSGFDLLRKPLIRMSEGKPWRRGARITELEGRVEEAPVPFPRGVGVVAFDIPGHAKPGERYLQVVQGKGRTYWTRFEVASQQQVEIRNAVVSQAKKDLIKAHGPEIASSLTLVARYSPEPVGAILKEVSDEDEGFKVEEPNTWLVYAFDRTAHFRQPYGTELICFYPPRDSIVRFPRGPIYRVGGGGFPSHNTLNSGVFDAGGKPEPVDPGEDEAPKPGPLSSTPQGPSGPVDGFTGRISTTPCPNGRHSAVIIIQLIQGEGDEDSGTDADGNPRLRPNFDEVARQVKSMLGQHLNLGTPQNPGPDRMDHLKPEDFLPDPPPTGFARDRVKLDLDKRLKPLLEAIKAQDNGKCCTDVTIIILSHGTRTGTNREHPLAYYYKQGGTEYKGNTGNRNRWNSTSDFLSKIAEVLGDGCIPVTVMDHSCYSGRTAANNGRKFNDALRGYPNHKIALVTSSEAGEVSGGHENHAGKETYYFFDALEECLADQRNDVNGDGRVSLKEALECVQRRTNERSGRSKAQGGAGRPQRPQIWPPLAQW